MAGPNEATARIKIDTLLASVGWKLDNTNHVRPEYVLSDGTKADYVLCDRYGKSLAVIEAKKETKLLSAASDQAKHYAELLDVPYIFLSNGEEILFWEWQKQPFPRPVKTFFSQADLENRAAQLKVLKDPMTVAIDRKVVERPYQVDCIDALCTEINNGRRKLLVEMATGTGKTRMAAAMIKRLFEANRVSRVLFLVDRITLAKQAEDAFNEHISDYPCYVLRSAKGVQDEKRITVATLQTMINEYPNFTSGYFDLVFTDECHRSIYGKWSGALKHFDGIQVGLTATPCVLTDADKLLDPEDGAFIKDTLKFFEVEAPTYSYTMKEAITEGYLVPYHIYKAQTVKTAAEDGFEVTRDDLDWSDMDETTKAEFEELFGTEDKIIVDPSALERKFTIPERNRAMVREYRNVLDNGFTGSDGVRRAPLLGKAIVFAVTKKHAETLAIMFDNEFKDQKSKPDIRYADFVVSDMGEGPTPGAHDIIKRFKDEEYPKILVSVNMLDTGFDAPEVVNLVMARFTKSAILYQQMRGRGTRKAPHIHKTHFTLFDFVGVTDFHGDDDEDIPGGYVIPQPPTPGTPTPRKLLTLDVHDHIDPSTREWVTLDENGNIVQTDEHEAKANDLGLKFESWYGYREDDFDAEQQRWLRLIESYVRANAMGLEQIGTWMFDQHPFTQMGGYNKAKQVFGGEDNLDSIIVDLELALLSDDADAHPAELRPTLQ